MAQSVDPTQPSQTWRFIGTSNDEDSVRAPHQGQQSTRTAPTGRTHDCKRPLRCTPNDLLPGGGHPHMRRRAFITLLGGAAVAWLSTARAQKIPLIAWLDGGGQPRPDSLVAFRSGLNNRGYVDGRNVVIGIHGVEQPEQLSEAITELMRESAAAIFVNASWKAVNAAKAATSTLPIVFADGSGDPVKLGIVASLARPGGNVTGVSMNTGRLVSKRLDLLRKVVPQAAMIAFLTNPNNLGSELDTMDVQAAARAMGQDLIVPNARRDNFEVNHHYYNLLVQLGPVAAKITQICRTAS